MQTENMTESLWSCTYIQQRTFTQKHTHIQSNGRAYTVQWLMSTHTNGIAHTLSKKLCTLTLRSAPVQQAMDKKLWKWSFGLTRARQSNIGTVCVCELYLCFSVVPVLDCDVYSDSKKTQKKKKSMSGRIILAPCFYRITQTLLNF